MCPREFYAGRIFLEEKCTELSQIPGCGNWRTAVFTVSDGMAASKLSMWCAAVCTFGHYRRVIITDVAFISAAAVCPLRSCISLAASAVMIEVMRCSPMASTTCARIP